MTLDLHDAADAELSVLPRTRWKAVRDAGGAVLGALLGIAPHVLHHIGLLAGAALITGAAGNATFYVLGLVMSIPLLRRLHRHAGSWQAPVLAVVAFSGLFALSAFVIGPAIAGTDDAPAPPSPSEPAPSSTPGPTPTSTHGHGH